MRLIDADAFKDWLLNRFMKPQDTLVLTLQGFIAEQPTAYDIDKVVEQLEKQKSGLTEWTEDEAFKLAIHKAIEIVKQGGVSDDVCEWKQDKSFNGMYKACRNYVTYLKDFEYCPYCGKKIKVVK